MCGSGVWCGGGGELRITILELRIVTNYFFIRNSPVRRSWLLAKTDNS